MKNAAIPLKLDRKERGRFLYECSQVVNQQELSSLMEGVK